MGEATYRRILGSPEQVAMTNLIRQVHEWGGNDGWHGGPAHAQLDDFNTDIPIRDLPERGPWFHHIHTWEANLGELAREAERWGADLVFWFQPDSPWPEFVERWNAAVADEEGDGWWLNSVALGVYEGFEPWDGIFDPEPEPEGPVGGRCPLDQDPVEITVSYDLCLPGN